jgi:hypothetical protein
MHFSAVCDRRCFLGPQNLVPSFLLSPFGWGLVRFCESDEIIVCVVELLSIGEQLKKVFQRSGPPQLEVPLRPNSDAGPSSALVQHIAPGNSNLSIINLPVALQIRFLVLLLVLSAI